MVHRSRQGLRDGRRRARERRRPHRAAKLNPARRFFPNVALLALTAGCSSQPAPPAPPVIVTLTAPSPPEKIIRIEFDGKPVPLIDDLHWKLTLPPRSDATTMAARFRIVLPTTCGDEPIEVTKVTAEGVLEAKWPTSSTVWIDREGVGSAATVSVGAFVVETTTAKVLVGACPTARDIRVGDAVVGQMGASTLVDAKGGHCYEVMTSGFPGARLEGARAYERAFDVFLPNETPADKVVLRRCGSSLVSFASAMGTTAAPPPTFTSLRPTKPPAPPPKPPPPKKRPRN